MISTAVPYALANPRFRFRALASLAGRSPLGGAREIALATYVVARLVEDCLPERALTENTRLARATAARAWLYVHVTGDQVRPALLRLIDATGGDTRQMHRNLVSVITVTADQLDDAAVSELEKLAQALGK